MGRKFAGAAFVCGIAGLPLLLLSYAWLPLALMGREVEFVRYAVVLGEIGALAAGALAVGLGVAARRRSGPGQSEHRLASRGLAMGGVVLGLVLVPNIVSNLLTAR
jgi:hypothetical protein